MAILANLPMDVAAPRFRSGNPGVWGTAGPAPRKRRPAPTKTRKATSTSLLDSLPSLLGDAEARDQALALLAPIFDAQNARINSAFDSRANAIRGAYDQLAQYGQGIAPAIQQAYQGASRDTAAFAKGFTDALAQASQGQAGAATAGLAAQGSPQTVTSGIGQGGGAALYAMGGGIPAEALTREGAAFTGAASFLPSTAAGLGVNALRESEDERIAELLDLEAERPGTVLEMVNSLTDRSYSRRQDAQRLALDEREFRYRASQDRFARTDKLKADQQERRDRQYEAAALKLAYGYKLSKREQRLLDTYGMTPDAVEAAGRAKQSAAEDKRRARAAAADDARSLKLQQARDRAAAARQQASDARKAMIEAQKDARRSRLEADKAKARKALEVYKAKQRKALQAQKDAAAMSRQKAKPKSKRKSTTVGNPGDSYFGE